MSTKPDGGPAFPTDNQAQTGPNTFHFEGMTLRDYFAAKAIAGMLADSTNASSTGQLVFYAYKIADAMLEERAKP